jgi:hypothetical protein
VADTKHDERADIAEDGGTAVWRGQSCPRAWFEKGVRIPQELVGYEQL